MKQTILSIHEAFNAHLNFQLNDLAEGTVVKAMQYSYLDGGKRFRPMLLLSLLFDLTSEYSLGLNAACALEAIHTYSLIHDDLPALDNDDLRRFKPTNHKVFGEDIAILAGDGLLTLAFDFISRDKVSHKCTQTLARCAGVQGMILGQELDLKDNIPTLDVLLRCYELKTGCLFQASLEIACILAERNDKLAIASEIGKQLGIAFQVQDDLLEIIHDEETIGKSSSSDHDRGKTTVTSFLSVDESKALLDTSFNCINDLLNQLDLKHELTHELIRSIDNRTW